VKSAARFGFRLYIAGTTSNSTQAITNLTVFCRAHLPGRHDIEVIDVLRHPHQAQIDGVFITPMLIKYAPKSLCRIIGTLSQPEKLGQALGLGQKTA
jgi:circadian clock protein KaiB